MLLTASPIVTRCWGLAVFGGEGVEVVAEVERVEFGEEGSSEVGGVASHVLVGSGDVPSEGDRPSEEERVDIVCAGVGSAWVGQARACWALGAEVDLAPLSVGPGSGGAKGVLTSILVKR